MKHLFLKSPRYPLVQRIVLGGGALILLFAINLIYSCQKSYDNTEPTNKRLHIRDGGINVSEGMLKFYNMDAVQSYLDAVDLARSYHYSDDDSDQLLSDVDPGVNDIESQFGFLCLSSLYDSLEYLDDEFRSSARGTLDIYISDSDLQLILNRNHEVWIEDTIYKFVDDFTYYKIVGADIGVLNSIRNDPEFPTVNDNTSLEYINGNAQAISFNTVLCKIVIKFLKAPPTSGIDPRIYITVNTVDQDGNVFHCPFPQVTINWGDGSSPETDYNNATLFHDYEVGADENKTFIITATMVLIDANDCGGCDEDTYEASTIFNVSNDFCKKFNTDNRVLNNVSFSAGGGDWKYYGQAGQTPRFHILNDAKVWGEIYTYKKIGGNFKRKRPDESAYVRIFKSVFDFDDCEENEDIFDRYRQLRDNKVRVEYKPGVQFSTQNELPDEPLLDFKEFITSSSTPNSTRSNIELHPD